MDGGGVGGVGGAAAPSVGGMDGGAGAFDVLAFSAKCRYEELKERH